MIAMQTLVSPPPSYKLNLMKRYFSMLLVATLVTTLASVHRCAAQEVAAEFSDPDWRFSLNQPSGDWQKVDFNDSEWEQGPGGFGTRGTPGARIATVWKTPDIWLRRKIHMSSVPTNVALLINHDEGAEVYINGIRVAAVEGHRDGYTTIPLDASARAVLRAGENTVAVHCHQTAGGQAIDVHVVDADNVPKLPRPKGPTEPFKSELITQWGSQVTAENVWKEYPRPQMAREDWTNLNGLWKYAVTPRKAQEPPTEWAGEILVPFALESKLSGVQKLLNDQQSLWYHREIPFTPAEGKRTLLKFEAVDYRCDVFLNGVKVGSHQGGNVPFSFDVTEALKSGSNELMVRVDDNTEEFQLRGKQSVNPGGIFYTQVSGIWQTVWMEQVAPSHLVDLKMTTDAKAGSITIEPTVARGEQVKSLRIAVKDGDRVVAESNGMLQTTTISVPQAKLWSPNSPHLYSLEISLVSAGGDVIDRVDSYIGIRSVGKKRDEAGRWRFTLNDEEIFHWGPLDQGWWPDGLLTPPSDAGMVFDIQFLKDAGFNMIRKHIKVEPRRYYYHCDKIGMMVWQDQVSGGNNPPWTRMDRDPKDADWSDADHQQFMNEFEAMIDELENHPSIVIWTPFNEAWGQHRTMEVGQWTVKRDPTRLVNIASGGNFWPVGDIADHHAYPHPEFPFDAERYKDFVIVVGEFGGHGLPSEGHLWNNQNENWGYGGLPKNKAEYEARYRESIRRLVELQGKGVAGGVYTQTTDVEGEINGLISYDREVIKISPEVLRKIHASLLD